MHGLFIRPRGRAEDETLMALRRDCLNGCRETTAAATSLGPGSSHDAAGTRDAASLHFLGLTGDGFRVMMSFLLSFS